MNAEPKQAVKGAIDESHEEQQPLIEKILSIDRVTKVTKGGRNLSFRTLAVVGDGEKKVGYGVGKANDVASSIKKAIKVAQVDLFEVPRKGSTITHEVVGKFKATRVMLKPAYEGTGTIASSQLRAVCECAGIRDILTKVLGKSTNSINVVKAAVAGFKELKPAVEKEEKKVEESTGEVSKEREATGSEEASEEK